MGSREHVGREGEGTIFNDVMVYEIGHGELNHFGGAPASQ